MTDIKISLFASSVRPQLYESLFKSIDNEPLREHIEIIFAGNATPPAEWFKVKNIKEGINAIFLDRGYPLLFEYIKTGNIKPAQCYEIARRACISEVIVWIADDCEFVGGIISKAYEYWKSQNNEKLILSIQTKESGYNLPKGQLFDMNVHRFFGGRRNTPLMAPLGMMSTKFLNDLGGIDRRYICGQYENDIVMRACSQGANVEIFGNKDCFIDIDHLGKSILIGESKTENDFLKRPFAKGYNKDREVLEKSWVKDGKVSFVQLDKFEPFDKENILTKSQSNNIPEMWE